VGGLESSGTILTVEAVAEVAEIMQADRRPKANDVLGMFIILNYLG
jgi:hypothetical protein